MNTSNILQPLPQNVLDYFYELAKDIDFKQPNYNEINTPNNLNLCPKCNTDSYLITDHTVGSIVCKNCGCTVISNLVDQNFDWHCCDDDTHECRIGSAPINPLLPVSSMGTTIRGGRSSNRIRRSQMWQQMPYKEKSLNSVFKDLQSFGEKGNISKCIIDDAKIMFKKAISVTHDKGNNKGTQIILRGKNRRGLIGACLYQACRRKKKTFSFKEIASICGIKYTEISKGCKILCKLLRCSDFDYDMGTTRAQDFIQRYCRILKLNDNIMKQAFKIAENLTFLGNVTAHTPQSLAFGSILMVAEINKRTLGSYITKKVLASKFKISEVTLSKTLKKIMPFKSILLLNDFKEKLDKILSIVEQNTDVSKIEHKAHKYDGIYDCMAPLKKLSNVPLSSEKVPIYLKQVEDEVLKMASIPNLSFDFKLF